MKPEDFRHMRQGRQLSPLINEDLQWLKPFSYTGKQKKRALLLLHGFSSSPAVYRLMIPEIQGYDGIHCPVFPGHADSIEAFSEVKAIDWVMAAEQVCESLLQTYEQVDVMGLSLGGVLACYLSERYNLNHLYLLAPALILHLSIQDVLKKAKYLRFLGFSQLRNAAGNLVHTQHTEIAYRRLPISAVREILFFIDEFRWIAPACPVDLFLGSQDIVVDSYQVSALFAHLPNTNIHWLKHSAHVLPLDNDMSEILNCINK